MSLRIYKEPLDQKNQYTKQLNVGTWFVNDKDQIFLVAMDDRTQNQRLICFSKSYKVFVTDIPINRVTVRRVLNCGTILQIIPLMKKGE